MIGDFWQPWRWAHDLIAFIVCRGDWLHGWRRSVYLWFASKSYWEWEMARMRKDGLV